MEEYLNSSFYKKYRDSYYSDCIMKDVFKKPIRKHCSTSMKYKSYEDVYRDNVRMMDEFLQLFWNESPAKDDRQAFQMIYSFYVDPDFAAIKKLGDIECTADGLISINRLYAHEGMGEDLIRGYELYRKTPIFYFPREKNGINMTRASKLGDKIDAALYDIKRYMEAGSKSERASCRLAGAYKLPITGRWLSDMGSFQNIVDWFGVRGIFTTEDYEVLDIEKGDGSVITGYLDTYGRVWSDDYYQSLKKKIELFMECRSSKNDKNGR